MTASLDKLKSVITSKGGIARPNNFLIELPSIRGVSSRDMNILCRNATLPGKQVLTHDRRIGMQFEKVAYGYAVDDVTLTFLLTNDYSVRNYFDAWRSVILDEEGQTVAYKNQYEQRVVIHQLANSVPSIFGTASINIGPISAGFSGGVGFPFDGNVNITTPVYSVELINAFPTTIGQIDFNNDADGFIEMQVQMSYTNWKKVPAGQTQIRIQI
jgi:hypothetical protein